ncbi:KH domain-containing protein [Candidatus Gottesmanbacteria bacterium]|nr:KH domain-containing protein [Candidatus Gottesmanbacteria bacterium]
MKDALLFLVQSIVDHPDDVVVVEQIHEDRTILELSTHPEDMGKVIGKAGRIIRAIRDLVKLIAAKRGVYADVEIVENESDQSRPITQSDQ